MIELYCPATEAELLVLRTVLDDAGIPYFVKNDAFGSLAVGPNIAHYNRKTVCVHPEDRSEAERLIAEFRSATVDSAPPPPLSGRDKIRLVVEFLLFGWIMPGRRPRAPKPPALRLIRGGEPPEDEEPREEQRPPAAR